MRKYAIENGSGQWWTGECWGAEQARAEYDSIDDLPDYIDDPELELEVFASDDMRYYAEGAQESEARVREVGE